MDHPVEVRMDEKLLIGGACHPIIQACSYYEVCLLHAVNLPAVGTVVPRGHIAILGYCCIRPGGLCITVSHPLWMTGCVL